MAIEIKRTTTIERILSMGQIEISERIETYKNDILISTSVPHHSVIWPDEEYEGDDEELKLHIAVAHRPEKKEAYRKFKEDRAVEEQAKLKVEEEQREQDKADRLAATIERSEV